MASDSMAVAVPGTLDQLVHQFADPMAFLRELLQNSIDAGSAVVEVRCELRQDQKPGDGGVLIISLEDWGEGMDRQIIETRLTRLFSSDKAGDRTKIGKFGIGFVSVFGIQPDAVCVDTARGGERWRILFRADRSFTLVRLDEPIEGTRVRVIKNIRAASYPEYEQRVRSALSFWCQHVEIELLYQGQRIDKPLRLDAPVEVREEGPLGTLCVGIAAGTPARAGFYNRGLALLERPSEWPGVSYKINSSRLGHTLSRDQVVQDESYYKLIGRVTALRASLFSEVLQRLESLLRDDALIGEWEPLQQWIVEQVHAGVVLPGDQLTRGIVRNPQGVPISVTACRTAAASGRMLLASEPSPLVEALESLGCAVILREGKSEVLARCLTGHAPLPIERRFFLALPVTDPAASLGWVALARAAQSMILSTSSQSVEVYLGQFAYSGSTAAGWIAAVQEQPFAVGLLEEARRPPSGAAWQSRKLVINIDHPTGQALRKVAEDEPEFAAYTLLKLLHLGIDLTASLDGTLLSAAASSRGQRVG